MAISLNNLAALYYNQGKYRPAELLFKRALAIVEKSLGPDHPYVITCLENMAALYQGTNRKQEADNSSNGRRALVPFSDERDGLPGAALKFRSLKSGEL